MKQVKKVFSVMLVLVMALGLLAGCNDKPADNKPNSGNGGDTAVDTTWYKDSETTFTLTKANQLMGLAELAKTKNFEGKTIKLGADIELNEYSEAILAKWQLGTVLPKNVWTPLGNVDLPFAGIIDGQGYKISGLFVSGAEDGTGFIGTAASTVELKNVKFVNGYIKNTKNKTGIIGAGAGAKVENVYTNLLIESYGNFIGGIIGYYQGAYQQTSEGSAEQWAKGQIIVNNCWFDGTLTTGGYAIGGCVGGQEARSKFVCTNFLSTGTINANVEAEYARAGGIFGWLNWSAEYDIQNCVSTTTVKAAYTGLDAMVGALIGDLGANGLKVTNSYGIGKKVIGRDQKNLGLDSQGILKTADEMKALDIATALPKLEGETASPWEKVDGSAPVLKGLK